MLKSRKKKSSDINIKKRQRGARPITSMPTAITAFIGLANHGLVNEPREVNSFLEFERAFGGLSSDSELGYAVRAFFENGGKRALIVRLDPADRTGITGNQAKQTGLYALEKADLFNLLSLPPFQGNNIDPIILNEAAKYCEERRAILIVDPPTDWDSVQEVENGYPIPGLNYSPNAAIYYPRIRSPDPLKDNQIETFVPSGAIAGVIALTDAQHGVWKAPAGTEASLIGVSDLSVPINNAENDELNSLGINCLRVFPTVGHVVWGARTMAGSNSSTSEWKYLPVRRLALYIEESITQGTSWTVFEPNDEPLWAQLRQIIGAFLHELFQKGAFQGATPKEAYFVKCDNKTTTLNDINLGTVNILVGFAPLKPAEFVVLKISLKGASP